MLEMPHSRPMSGIGARCHELRVVDFDQTWRIIYRIDSDAIVILDVFSKKTRTTPQLVINRSRKRLREYDDA
jgi:phage-related protein